MSASTPEPAPEGLRARALRRLLVGAQAPRAPLALGLVAFTDAAAFLVPAELLLLPMSVVDPGRWRRFAAATVVGSVLGALVNYATGWGAFEWLGRPLLEASGAAGDVDAWREAVRTGGALAAGVAAVLPLPYKVVGIVAGASGVSLPGFALATLVGRSIKYGLLAWVAARYGEPAVLAIRRNAPLVTGVLLGALGLVVLWRWLAG